MVVLLAKGDRFRAPGRTDVQTVTATHSDGHGTITLVTDRYPDGQDYGASEKVDLVSFAPRKKKRGEIL